MLSYNDQSDNIKFLKIILLDTAGGIMYNKNEKI